MKKVVLFFVLCSTAVSAQRYSGSGDISHESTKVLLNGHGIGGTQIPITGDVIASMDLTVDDSQSVIFHEFKIEIDGRFDVANNVYGLINATMVIDEHLDLNPIMVDDRFHIRDFDYDLIDVTVEWHNRNFENTVSREFGRQYDHEKIDTLALNYENYPDSMGLEAIWPTRLRQLNFTSAKPQGPYMRLEPELMLQNIFIGMDQLRMSQIELLPVEPPATRPMINPRGKFNLEQILAGKKITAVPESIPMPSLVFVSIAAFCIVRNKIKRD